MSAIFHEEQPDRIMSYKPLGISPEVINGIRGWRVIWRPIVDSDCGGGYGYRKKAENVCTEWFPIVGEKTDVSQYQLAAALAAKVYNQPMQREMPAVNWQLLAKVMKQTLRDSYAKPCMTDKFEQAKAMFEAGHPDRVVAQQLGIHRTTAIRWRRKLNKKALA